MHELSIMSSILDIILDYAGKNNAKKIRIVNLKIGVLSDIIPDWAQTYFDMLTRDTIAEGSVLVIEKVPVSLKCRECGFVKTYDEGDWKFSCEKCESADIELLSGRDLYVSSIEIE